MKFIIKRLDQYLVYANGEVQNWSREVIDAIKYDSQRLAQAAIDAHNIYGARICRCRDRRHSA